MGNEKREAILEVERLVGELKEFSRDDDFKSIYQACEAIMITIDEADLEDLD